MERFQYNSFQPDFCQQVLDVFRREKSVKAVSVELPIGEASVFRLLKAAVENGALAPEQRDLSLMRRETVLAVLERHPDATIAQIADLAGVSEATVYRAKKGE